MLKKVCMLFFIVLFVSCQKEETLTSLDKDLNSKFVSAEELQEMRQKAGDVVYDESNMDQLMAHIDSLSSKRMNDRGFKKNQPFDKRIQTRVVPEMHSYIERRHDYHVFQSVKGEEWVRIKLYDELADKINEQYKYHTNTPKNRVERNKTYICTWRYMEPCVQLAPNQFFGAVKSTKCGFKPSNRKQLLNCWRDYESYENSSKQVMMLSYVLEVICLDVNEPTPLYDFFLYPVMCDLDPSIPYSEQGYVFNYAILTF